jgi:hypothetical protein
LKEESIVREVEEIVKSKWSCGEIIEEKEMKVIHWLDRFINKVTKRGWWQY